MDSGECGGLGAGLKPAIEEFPKWTYALAGLAGRGVRVALIDSGFDAGSFLGNVTPGRGYVRADASMELEESADWVDRHGHGTAIANAICKWAPGCEIVPLRVFGTRLETKPEAVVLAVSYAVEVGCDIIHLSAGSWLDHSRSLFEGACTEAFAKGIAVVAAANLCRGRWSSPACDPQAISVAGGKALHPVGLYRLEGLGAHFAARSCRRNLAWLGGQRMTKCGSSYAAPLVTAVVARLAEVRRRHSPSEILSRLSELADGKVPLPADSVVGETLD